MKNCSAWSKSIQHQTFTTQIKENCFITYNPNKKLFLRNEKSYCRKKSKMKLTVLLTVNIDGTHKLKPLTIGKSENLWCFPKNIQILLTKYATNKKLWMTSSLFKDFFRYLDKCMRIQKRKMLFFKDWSPPHPFF